VHLGAVVCGYGFAADAPQYVPGVTLLLLAPVLIIWIGVDFGWIVGVLSAAAFVSIFRNPLLYIYARMRGEKPEIPK